MNEGNHVPYCCDINCIRDAKFGILSEGKSADLETHACEKHLAEMLEPGVSTVWHLFK